MKKVGLFLISLLLLLTGTSCGPQKVLSFSLFSTSNLKRDAAPSEEVAKKIDGWYRYAEKFMGMKIVIDQELLKTDKIEHRCNEYIRLDDLADVFVLVDSSGVTLKQLAAQGKIINLMDYKEHMPHYSRMLSENLNFERVHIDGALYSFAAAVYNPAEISQNSWLYNYSVFQKNGMRIPRSLDELYQAAKKLKQLYPDSYPIMFNNTNLLAICEAFGFLNRLQLLHHYDGSAYRVGLFSNPDDWRNTVQYMSRLYQEGLISPDFDTCDSKQREFNATNGLAFIIPQTSSEKIKAYNNSSDYEWVCGNTPNGLGNQEPFYPAEPRGNTLSPSWNICISAEAKNPELLVKLLDNEYADATMDLYNWGKKGVLYDVDADGRKYLIPKTADELNRLRQENPSMDPLWWNQNRRSQMAKNALLNPVPTVFNDVYEKTDFWMFSEKYIRADNMLPNDVVAARVVQSRLTPEERVHVDVNIRGIQKFVLDTIRQFIKGEKDFRLWDEFIEEAKEKGDYLSLLKVYGEKLKQLQ